MVRQCKDGVGLGVTNYWVKERLQECIVQYKEHSQYFVIVVHGV